jgi:hypothetical protein
MNNDSIISLSSALGIDSTVLANCSSSSIKMPEEPTIPVPGDNAGAEADFDFARKNLIVAITTGERLLRKVTGVAIDSESARAFEVAANMLNTQVAAAKSLIALREQSKNLGVVAVKSPSVGNNTAFVGSTSEVHAMFRKKHA